jgi:hypothetical protein
MPAYIDHENARAASYLPLNGYAGIAGKTEVSAPARWVGDIQTYDIQPLAVTVRPCYGCVPYSTLNAGNPEGGYARYTGAYGNCCGKK